MKKVVLAFSGGLDTSYCAKYLAEALNYEVIAVTVNTGGFNKTERQALEQKAKKLGVSDYHFIDETTRFYAQGIRYLLFGNVLKNNTYPLSVSAERVFQAVAIANYATSIKAGAIAHGSTGAGNDQVRFDLVFEAMCPGTEIITPIRDMMLSREEEISYLQKHGVEDNWEKAAYSINKGLWGTSVGGKETLTPHLYLPEDAFPSPLKKVDSETVRITFEKGEPVGLNDNKMAPVEVITALGTIASEYAIGRDIHIGDTIIGIKGRVGFEAAAPLILIKAHHTLEKHVLTRQQLVIKDQLAAWYGNMMHGGQYLDPVMRDIEVFLESSQKKVYGDVEVLLAPYRFTVLGIQSPYDLMQSAFGQYGEMNKQWTGDDVRGFTKILANQTKLVNAL